MWLSMPRRTLLALVAITVAVALGGAQTWAAYSATSTSAGNSFAAGTVALADNDSGTALLSLSAAVPGNSDSGCITVSYTGSLASAVRLYGTTTGTGLDAYLDLKVTRGGFSGAPPAFDSCTTFTPDATDYIGSGSGVIYNGTLQGFPDDYAAGHADPLAASPETWTTNETHVYKLQVTLQDNPAAQGKDAPQTFTWEARNT
jgi:predicted ribosomally synthesized peptide with SipW-like signal peptide